MANWKWRWARTSFAAVLLMLAGCGGGGGGSSSVDAAATSSTSPPTVVTPPSTTLPPVVTPPDQPYSDPVAYSVNSGDALSSAVEAAAVTHHQITIGTSLINYTASAGHLTANDLVTGNPSASMFYVAYTEDGAAAATRPITFFYNGGPGSSTIWLHLGSFAPRRLVTGDPSNSPATPFPFVDNAESLLDTTDLVFVDAVGTGYSEAITPNINASFWSVDTDAQVFRDFVIRYLAANGRTASPKFLFGESYGTTRSAVLASDLESAGVALNGVILQSSILNYNSNCDMLAPGTVSCAGYLPSYGTVAAYYALTTPAQANIPAYAAQMRTYTSSVYSPLENQFLISPGTPPGSVSAQLFGLTGIAATTWQSHFDFDPTSFQYALIPGSLIGRYDARVSAAVGSTLAQDGDPSSSVVTAPFTVAIAAFLPQFLKYTSASPYSVESNAIYGWNFYHDGQALPDVIPDLATALAQNASLKVLSLNGYDDLATPFYQTELDLARLGAVPNLTITHYNGGHMIYLDDGSRPLEKADIVTFIRGAL